ncbi:hypothetical protein BGX28_005592 [Mortierella sp. GBA30]|nr:hypothetical protein BGX28_005592 [Mortierella sp. GBA30]
MGLEEGMRMPKQLDVFALTTLTRASQEDIRFRMPGSFPFSTPQQQHHLQQKEHHQQQAVLSDSRYSSYGGHSRSCTGTVSPMTSVLACPKASTQPWSLLMTIALDAWKKWIQTVHAGQAQFQDWCEYLLEMTIDQLIESVAFGLTVLGLESPVIMDSVLEDHSHRHHSQQQCNQSAVQPLSGKTKRIRQQSRESEESYNKRQKLSGLHRAGKKILKGCPSLEGAVRSFGNSWLGQKIRNRLERKLDMVADQVVDWWVGDDELGISTVMSTESDSSLSLSLSLSASIPDKELPVVADDENESLEAVVAEQTPMATVVA